MIKALTTLAVGLPVAAVALVAAPGTANADLGDCPRTHFCAWADDNYKGRLAHWVGNDSDWGNDGMHDNAESLFNNAPSTTSSTPDNVWVYRDPNYIFESICLLPGETVDIAMDDNDYDSHKWVGSCS